MFESEIRKYEELRREYREQVTEKMGNEAYWEYVEILFSTHSCAIEGNSFTIDDTRVLKEQGLGMIPGGRSLLECTEMADHLAAFEYMLKHLNDSFDEALLKEINRLVTLHTLAYRHPDAVPGEYTDRDMAAGDTLFGDHQALIARVPELMSSTEKALQSGIHPMIVAAKFHGFYEYLHPFRDGNGRTGRLMSNFLLLRAGHPLLIIDFNDRAEYIRALQMIRSEGTNEYLISLFFSVAMRRMQSETAQKRANSHPMFFF